MPVRPDPIFRQSLLGDLQRQLRAQHTEEQQDKAPVLPEGLCPFTEFCYAKLPLPTAMRAACPCLKAQKVLRRLVNSGAPIRTRPCLGLAIQAERATA
jgi:hypothetical protein